MKWIFHGTNAILLDNGLVSGTYFTDDLEIAIKYGKAIYAIDSDRYIGAFSINCEGYYVSRFYIDITHFIILRSDEK